MLHLLRSSARTLPIQLSSHCRHHPHQHSLFSAAAHHHFHASPPTCTGLNFPESKFHTTPNNNNSGTINHNNKNQQTTTNQITTNQQITTNRKHNNEMKLTFLGTSSGVPTFDRNVSNINLSLGDTDGSIFVFDCGEGTQNQFRRSTLKSGKITTIFITHLHGDHIFGLPGFLCTLSGNNPPTRSEVRIYGPVGIFAYVQRSLQLSDSHSSFTIRIFEIVPPPASTGIYPESEQFQLIPSTTVVAHQNAHHHHHVTTNEHEQEEKLNNDDDDVTSSSAVNMVVHGGYITYDTKDACYHVHETKDGITIRACPIFHRVFTLGYVIQEQDSMGKLDMEKAKQLGVPRGPLLSILKSGKSVTLEDGVTVVTAEQVLGPVQKGRKIVILGDTHDPSPIAHLAQGCDILTHESTLSNSQLSMAVDRGHSCPVMAASFAKKIQARNLILTHFSARFSQEGVRKDRVDSVDLLKLEAEEVFTPEDGTVYLANDFRSFVLHKDRSVKVEQQDMSLVLAEEEEGNGQNMD